MSKCSSSAAPEGAGAPDADIEATPEMIEAGIEFFYGTSPFCDRPANRGEIEVALKSAYSAMRQRSHF